MFMKSAVELRIDTSDVNRFESKPKFILFHIFFFKPLYIRVAVKQYVAKADCTVQAVESDTRGQQSLCIVFLSLHVRRVSRISNRPPFQRSAWSCMWNSHRYVFIPMAVPTAWLYDTTIKLEANYAPAEWYRNCHIAYMENEESTWVGNIILKTTVAYWFVFLNVHQWKMR